MHIVDTAAPPRLLSAIAIDFSSIARFEEIETPEPQERTSARVFRNSAYDIWLIRWGVGSRTVLHDHGGSAGALYVVSGELVEERPNPTGVGRPLRHRLREFDHRPMASSHVHEIANATAREAASIHVYSPPLESMNHYERTHGSQIRMIRREADRGGYLARE